VPASGEGAGTIRSQLITVPGRLARSARRLTLHLPAGWAWHKAWQQLATGANSPPLHLADPPVRQDQPENMQTDQSAPSGHPARHDAAGSTTTPST